MLANLVALAAASGVTFLITPFVKRLAQRLDIIDKPDRKRKKHRRLVPLWGGLAIAFSLLVSFIILITAVQEFQPLWTYRGGYFINRMPWIGLAYLIIIVFGLLDDKRPLPPKVKLLAQFIAVGIIMSCGLFIKALRLPGVTEPLSIWPLIGVLLSMVWMLSMINAFNFIDGVDGLASSQAIISGLGLTIGGMLVAGQSESLLAKYQCQLGAAISATAAGAALGFIRYNRWPAKLFLGDAGSTLLGFSLCLSGLLIIGEAPGNWVVFSVIFILGWPILDTIQVVIRRWSKGEPVSKADNRHLHHELQKKGFTKTATVAFINVVSIIFVAMGIGLLWL